MAVLCPILIRVISGAACVLCAYLCAYIFMSELSVCMCLCIICVRAYVYIYLCALDLEDRCSVEDGPILIIG